MKDDILLTPGPTPLPPQVREALGQPIMHHRTKPFRALFQKTLQGMRTAFQTAQPVFCLTGSGTGAMETAVVNLLSPGDEAVVVLGGKFAERWQELCQAYGVTVATVPVAYGDAVDPRQVAQALKSHPKAKAVFTTLLETSTGVVNDIQAIAALTRNSPAVLVVDAISGLLSEPCQTDAWGVDMVVTGSQKGLMLPPGLAFLSAGPRVWPLIEASKSPRYYYDLRLYKKALADDDTPFTAGVSLVMALDAALQLILKEGVPQMIQRCERMAKATRAAMQALGLELFAKRPGNGVTAVKVPDGVDGKKLTALMYERSRVMIAGGQGQMAGKIFRFAHMGFISPQDILVGLDALEQALAELGRPVQAGAARKAAEAVLARGSGLGAGGNCPAPTALSPEPFSGRR
ncbi:MAG: alanine--glyoxylate aminotransferase family protein [Candidatus Omnitrophica bacterium]|nr:alanine--glyoxylate aminotransferase family protein [Candidatus Omnitrophota bacterium]